MIHSTILFWMPKHAYEGDVIWGNGRDGGYLVLGNMVYTVSCDGHVGFEFLQNALNFVALASLLEPK